MRTLLTGLILLRVYCCGFRENEPVWGVDYTFRVFVRSLTNGLEERSLSYVSRRLNKQIIRIEGSSDRKGDKWGDLFFINREVGKYDRVQRYFTTATGQSKQACVIYRQSKGFADSYRLPPLSSPELKYRLKLSLTFGNFKYEQWYRAEKIDNLVIIMETVWVRYDNDHVDKQVRPRPMRRSYKEFTLPGGTVSVHKIYKYVIFHTNQGWRPEFYDPIQNKKYTRIKYPQGNVTCKEISYSHLIDGSSDKNGKEIVERQNLLKKRSQMVKEHNGKISQYKLELNQFSRMTDEELKVYASCNDDSRINITELKNAVAEKSEQNINLPESINWRLNGAVTPVREQEDCASCWAFAVVGAMESFYYINSNGKELPMLSEQVLIDCVWSLNGTISSGSRGCLGGKLEYGFEWITRFGGIQKTVDYGSYEGHQGICHYVPENTLKLKKFKFVEFPRNLEIALVQHGPVAVFIQADLKFMFYKSGIYECKDGDTFTNHVALLVGYEKRNGQNYWLIKNSWGRAWGEDGYVRIKYTRSSCGPIRYGFLPVE